MFCEECGKELKDGAAFCPGCGTSTGAAGSQAPAGQPLGNTASVGQPVGNMAPLGASRAAQPAGGREKGAKVLCGVVSVLCCLLMVLAGVCASIAGSVRHAVSKPAIHSFVKGTDFAELDAKFLENGKGKTLSDYLYESFPSNWRAYIRKAGVSELLNARFVKDFVEDTLNDYIQDFLREDGSGEINMKDLQKMLKDNWAEILEMLITDQRVLWGNEWKMFVEDLEDLDEEEILEEYSLSVYRDENEETFALAQTLLSSWMIALLVGVACVLALLVFLIQEKKRAGLLYAGVSLACVGVADLILGAVLPDKLASVLNGIIEMGRKVFTRLLEPFHQMSMGTGGVLIGAGVVCCLIFLLTKLLSARKSKAPVRMRV